MEQLPEPPSLTKQSATAFCGDYIPVTVPLRVKRLSQAEGLPLPAYATEGSAGLDLCAATEGDVTLGPGERTLIPTGLILEIPSGYEGQVRARSGLAIRKGLGMVNAPGTIDSDYRGEVSVILINWSAEPQTIRRGERIAQLVIAPVARVVVEEATLVDATPRGEGGFGHTGV